MSFFNRPKRIFQQSSKRLLCLGLLAFSLGAQADEYTLNFKNADLKELIKYVADANGLTVVIDPKVKGKVELVSNDSVNEKELYDLFLSVLDIHGFAAIRNGNVVRVVRSKEARSEAGPVVDGAGSDLDNEFVTEVIQLENINAAKLIPILRPLIPQQNHMAAYADSNAIIVASSRANIDRIGKIIARIDLNAVEEAEMIQLKHASADDAAKLLEKLAKGAGGDAKAPPSKKVQIVADKRTNTLIISGDPASRKRLVALAKKLDSPLEQSGNARVRYLKYANAKDLSAVLTKVVQNMSKMEQGNNAAKNARNTKDGSTIEADEATNSLIITAQADVMQSIDAIVNQLDIPRAQVLVEAIIVEVQNNNGKNLGVDWLFANEHGGFGSNSVSGTSALNNVALAQGESDTARKLGAMATALSAVPGNTWGVGRVKEDGTSIAGLLTALQTQTDTNILSTPSLLTLDNHEASITVGQEVPFVTGSYSATGNSSSTPGNPFQTVERSNVGITLKVTPRISEDGNVEMDLVQEVSDVIGSAADLGGAGIVTSERKIETSVVSRDGEIVVLGGLMQDKINETERKIPILGDIPWLGRLFKNSSTQIDKTNLLIFIKPTIIQDVSRLAAVSKDKYNYIRDKQLGQERDGVDLFPDNVVPILPEWENQVRQIETLRKAAANSVYQP